MPEITSETIRQSFAALALTRQWLEGPAREQADKALRELMALRAARQGWPQ